MQPRRKLGHAEALPNQLQAGDKDPFFFSPDKSQIHPDGEIIWKGLGILGSFRRHLSESLKPLSTPDQKQFVLSAKTFA
jgi:hypothetical protein